jgi:hypothetical protein
MVNPEVIEVLEQYNNEINLQTDYAYAVANMLDTDDVSFIELLDTLAMLGLELVSIAEDQENIPSLAYISALMNE